MRDLDNLRNKRYYQIAKDGSSDFTHPAMIILKNEISKVSSVLDYGCGEGTRLVSLVEKGSGKKKLIGVDTNKFAINLATRQYHHIEFIYIEDDVVPLKSESFDLVYSAFVLEHLDNPEKSLSEMVRLTKNGGKVFLVAPNYGAPNRRSPNSRARRMKKLISGFISDIKLFFIKNISALNWAVVEPALRYERIDDDTITEPYLNSLIKYTVGLGLSIEYTSSFWKMDRWSIFQLPFRILGVSRVYPFNLWGPHLCLILKK